MRKSPRARLGFSILGALAAFVALAPYLSMVLNSLKVPGELFKKQIFPRTPQWSNYIDVWYVSSVGDYFRNSLFITVIGTLLVQFVAAPAAYHLARNDFKLKKPYLMLVLVAQMIAPVAVLIGVFDEFRTFGLIDNLWALVITNAAFHMAFAVWILTSFFQTIPKALEESAAIDGCGSMGILRRIILPLAAPGLVTSSVFSFVGIWNEYAMALTLMSTDNRKPLSVGITSFIGLYDAQWAYLFATAVMGIVPIVVMFAIVEKRLVGGLSAGAVK